MRLGDHPDALKNFVLTLPLDLFRMIFCNGAYIGAGTRSVFRKGKQRATILKLISQAIDIMPYIKCRIAARVTRLALRTSAFRR